MTDIQKIEDFISKHHVLTIATVRNNTPYTCSAFYAYDTQQRCFIFASDEKTQHIQNILSNPNIAANIHLETKEIGKIQGLQIEGICTKVENKALAKYYFKTFPYALALQPTLWKITPKHFKYTDNRLGFGKKVLIDLETLD
ncbi:MAG: hypothetical protein GXO11_00785 [Epsilonproteobacteria bacterium]|nr:hypothetical protein [Campylobacterota bacterium]